MKYEEMRGPVFFRRLKTEEDAVDWLWRCRYGGKPFQCPKCGEEGYWQLRIRSEIRQCSTCRHSVRVRAGTIFQASKMPLLTWFRAIYLVMQDKRGVSALAFQRQMGLTRYETAWGMLQKIREALRQKDESYLLGQGVIELDGACFGRQETSQQTEILIAIETKDWVDDKGRPKEKAGFAKGMVAPETKENAQKFVNKAIKPGAMVNTDSSPALRTVEGVDLDHRKVSGDKEAVKLWLPWVHRFISNAKTWLLGTHHGVEAKHLRRYLAEYTYRFNRRHDPNSWFHRALYACAIATPITLQALTG